MPVARGGCMGGVVNGQIVIVGGEGNARDINPNGVFPDTDVYDPVADMWRVMAPMRTPRHGTGAAGVGNKLYVPGGATAQGGGTAVAILEAFTLPYVTPVCRDARTTPSDEDDHDDGRTIPVRPSRSHTRRRPSSSITGGSGSGVGGSGSGSALHTAASQIVPGDIAPCPASAWQLAWHCGSLRTQARMAWIWS